MLSIVPYVASDPLPVLFSFLHQDVRLLSPMFLVSTRVSKRVQLLLMALD